MTPRRTHATFRPDAADAGLAGGDGGAEVLNAEPAAKVHGGLVRDRPGGEQIVSHRVDEWGQH